MIVTKVFKDLSEYEYKFGGLLTRKQLIHLIPAGILAIFIWIISDGWMNEEIRGYFVIICIAPIIATGFISYRGYDFITFSKIWLKQNFGKRIFTIKEEVDDEKVNKKKTRFKKQSKRTETTTK